ncbi:hypothetical protein LQR30_18575 [Chromobacterium piscinae]|uniref:hypothetical protein n=1 Tax=Chromobacterium piscinae TaxID=686831 RepID=UPI001E63C48C|nr:hypothetical protein [Chromobacterium piscinae]MCD4506097.1 hypothetical protein [Chromobacterium piscinae]
MESLDCPASLQPAIYQALRAAQRILATAPHKHVYITSSENMLFIQATILLQQNTSMEAHAKHEVKPIFKKLDTR